MPASSTKCNEVLTEVQISERKESDTFLILTLSVWILSNYNYNSILKVY